MDLILSKAKDEIYVIKFISLRLNDQRIIHEMSHVTRKRAAKHIFSKFRLR